MLSVTSLVLTPDRTPTSFVTGPPTNPSLYEPVFFILREKSTLWFLFQFILEENIFPVKNKYIIFTSLCYDY